MPRRYRQAQRDGAIIAAHCGAGYFLADAGLLDRKRATISWWLKAMPSAAFRSCAGTLPVSWSGTGDLHLRRRVFQAWSSARRFSRILASPGERLVRKLLVLPPSRQSQAPYEFPLTDLLPMQEPLRDRSKPWQENSSERSTLPCLARNSACRRERGAPVCR